MITTKLLLKTVTPVIRITAFSTASIRASMVRNSSGTLFLYSTNRHEKNDKNEQQKNMSNKQTEEVDNGKQEKGKTDTKEIDENVQKEKVIELMNENEKVSKDGIQKNTNTKKTEEIEVGNGKQDNSKAGTKEIDEKMKNEIIVKSKQSEISFWLTLIAALGGLAGVVSAFIAGYTLIYIKNQKVNEIKTLNSELKKKYSEEDIELPSYFVKDQSVEKQLESIFEILYKKGNSNQYPVVLILGGQGIGKSTALTHIIKNKRKSEPGQIYYFHFRSADYIDNRNGEPIESSELPEKILNNLLYALTFDEYISQSCLVIDDINYLEKVSYSDKSNIIEKIFQLQLKGLKIMLVSSSTSFYQDVWEKTSLYKLPLHKEFVVWEMGKVGYHNVIEAFRNNKKISNKIAEKVESLGYTLREATELINLISNEESDEKKLTIIEEQESIKEKKIQNQIKAPISKKFPDDKNLIEKMFYSIINESEMHSRLSDALNNCSNIIEMGGKGLDKIVIENNIALVESLAEMDKQNLIIFCYPRSEAYRRYLSNYFQIPINPKKNKINKEPSEKINK